VTSFVLATALLAAAQSSAAAAAADPSGYWSGTLTEFGADLHVQFAFARGADGRWSGSFSAPSQLVAGYPLDSVTVEDDSVSFALGGGSLRFTGREDAAGAALQGTLTLQEHPGTFRLHRAAPPSVAYTEEEVSFASGDVTLAGTLVLPKAPGPHRAVVLVHGSGYETRWGTNLAIAERMAESGIVALAYDKRGTGTSTGHWETARYEELAGDAVAGIALLKKRPEVDPAFVGVWGHSQGAFLAPEIAVEGGAAFVVAADGMAEEAYKQDLYRTREYLVENGVRGDDLREAFALYAQFVDVARTGRGYDALRARMQRDDARSWYALLGIPARSSYLWSWGPTALGYDARTYWRSVVVPVLLMYGENDRTVPVRPSIDTIEGILRERGNEAFASVIVPRADHALHVNPAANEPFFWWYAAHDYPGLGIGWIRALPAAAPSPINRRAAGDRFRLRA
jgi:alpha-beta hydrolase superfamily lysophospholipase